MSYPLAFFPGSRPKYSYEKLDFARKILLKLEDKQLFLALKASQLYYYAADVTWKEYYLSRFV